MSSFTQSALAVLHQGSTSHDWHIQSVSRILVTGKNAAEGAAGSPFYTLDLVGSSNSEQPLNLQNDVLLTTWSPDGQTALTCRRSSRSAFTRQFRQKVRAGAECVEKSVEYQHPQQHNHPQQPNLKLKLSVGFQEGRVVHLVEKLAYEQIIGDVRELNGDNPCWSAIARLANLSLDEPTQMSAQDRRARLLKANATWDTAYPPSFDLEFWTGDQEVHSHDSSSGDEEDSDNDDSDSDEFWFRADEYRTPSCTCCCPAHADKHDDACSCNCDECVDESSSDEESDDDDSDETIISNDEFVDSTLNSPLSV